MKRKAQKTRQRQLVRWVAPLILFVAFNAVLRLALMPINQAEYTDGILQVTQFENQTGIWPPLYTALVWPFSLLIGPLWGGRLVSALFSAAAVIPLYLIARRSFGFQAALFTALLYTVAPVGLRWAPRVMTDATFCFFFWFACERILAAQGAKDREYAEKTLVGASLLGTLAALTRYQGIILALPIFALVLVHWRVNKFICWRGLVSLATFGLVPLWTVYAGNIHGEQFSDRLGAHPVMNTILNLEPFLLYLPYFLTYPVAVVVMIGMIKGRSRPRLMFKPLTFYLLAAILIMQSAFGSFQERYLLPVIGLMLVWGGVGLAAADNILRKSTQHRLRPYLPIVTVVWCVFVSVLALIGSREAFGDIRDASRRAAEVAGDERRIFTNEIFRPGRGDAPHIAADKVRFFAKRDVIYLEEGYYTGRKRLYPGDVLVMSGIYMQPEAFALLQEMYVLEADPEYPDGFTASVIPIFPDLMVIPGTNQNPAWFLYRYTPQPFTTRVYTVREVRRR